MSQLLFLSKGKKSVHFQLAFPEDMDKIHSSIETAEWSSNSWLSLYLITLNMLLWTCSAQESFPQWCFTSNLNFVSAFGQKYLHCILGPGIIIFLWLLRPGTRDSQLFMNWLVIFLFNNTCFSLREQQTIFLTISGAALTSSNILRRRKGLSYSSRLTHPSLNLQRQKKRVNVFWEKVHTVTLFP